MIHLNLKDQIIGQINTTVNKDVKIAALSRYLHNLWRTLKMSLIVKLISF